MSEFFQAFGTFLSECAAASLTMIFLENMLFSRALDTGTALVIIRKKNNLLLFGSILTGITVLSGIATYFLEPLIRRIVWADYIRPLIYIAVIAVVYIIALIVCGNFKEEQKQKIMPMIHISAFNFVVLGTLLLTAGKELTLASSLGYGLGAGIGFMLATFFISVAYDYLHSAAIPKAFRGFPVLLVYIGLLSLAFYGLIGHQLPY